jgi:hypothetical protein
MNANVLYHSMIQTDVSSAWRMPVPEMRHTTGALPTRMIRFHVRTRERPTDRPSVYSGRPFLFIAPEMRCLDIVWVVIPPRSSHPFGIPMIWHDVVVVGELFVADRAFSVLFDNLAI